MKDEIFLQIAEKLSELSTCPRRKVGCVLTNKFGHIIGSGFNGVPKGFRHCTDIDCGGSVYSSGEGLDKCFAVHAEQNALLQCVNIMEIYSCYTTTAMCSHCTKMMLNTSCKRLIYREAYKKSFLNLWDRELIQL